MCMHGVGDGIGVGFALVGVVVAVFQFSLPLTQRSSLLVIPAGRIVELNQQDGTDTGGAGVGTAGGRASSTTNNAYARRRNVCPPYASGAAQAVRCP